MQQVIFLFSCARQMQWKMKVFLSTLNFKTAVPVVQLGGLFSLNQVWLIKFFSEVQ